MIWTLAEKVLGPVLGVIDKAVTDKDEANRLKAAVQAQAMSQVAQTLSEQASIIRAEAQGDSWLQRNWRPVTMLTFVALVVAKWLGVTDEGVSEAVEVQLMELIKVGLGGYVIGRSAEKVVKLYKGGSDGKT